MKNKVHRPSPPPQITIIDEDQLASLVSDVIMAFKIKDDVLDIPEPRLKATLYDLCLYELKRRRWFYKGLNKDLLFKHMRIVVKPYTFKQDNPPQRTSDRDLFERMDRIAWRKVQCKRTHNDQPDVSGNK